MSRPTITFQVYSPIDYGDRNLHNETVTAVWIFKPTIDAYLPEGRNQYTDEPIMYLCTSSNLMLTPHPDTYIIWQDMKYLVQCNTDLYTIVNNFTIELKLINL